MKLTKNFWMKMIPVFAIVAATFFLSVIVYTQMMAMERESCWERLEIATNSTSGKIKVRLDDNMNFLKAVSDSYILTHNIEKTEEVGKYLSAVIENTIYERIDVILPDNRVITPYGTITDRNGDLGYEEILALDTHVSGRRISSFTGEEVICCVTPIREEENVIGLLVGTISCETLGKLFEVFTYGGDAQLFLIDCADGNYIIDNWHEELGNIYELGQRRSIDGSGIIDMAPAIINREERRFAYISETNGKNSYQYCTPVAGYNWELCVVVQDDVVFAHAYKLKNILLIVGALEICLIVLYIGWNMRLTIVAAESEEQAKTLEYEKAKNEARTRFISNMSHDIRTPLNGIVGMLQIIKNHRQDHERVDDCLRKIAVSTQYLSTLASDMLDINEIENDKLILQKDRIDLRNMAEELGVIVETKAQEDGVQFQRDDSELSCPYVLGSEIHIKRILINLIGNAIKYSKDAGKQVWFIMKDEPLDSEQLKRMYQFIVKDNGIGMTEDFQKNMYHAFEQENVSARSDYQGYGLGLTIVKQLVSKMNGTIDLESEKGVGSTFIVSIPLSITGETVQQELEEEAAAELTGMKILIVEDNVFNMEIANVILTDAGAVTDTAADGKTAAEKFAGSKPGTYDLILMDLMMPVMDGCEATRTIRAMDRPDAGTIPIIAMTASTFEEEIKRCRDAGMNAHLAKPLDVHKLLRELSKYNKTAETEDKV